MRVGVVGTSNSILTGGYVDQLSHKLGPFRLDNHSVGGSTIHLLSYAATRHELARYNVILIDILVNEYGHKLRGGHDLGVSLRILSGFLSDVMASGATPIFIAFPHKRAIDDGDAAFIDPYMAMAQRHGCPVINLYRDLYDRRAAGDAPEQLWLDDAHMALSFHQNLAERLHAFVKARGDGGWLPPDEEALAARTPFCAAAEFHSAGLNIPTVERGSRLLKLNYLGLPLRQPIPFSADGGAVYGLAYNAVKFCGKVEITANGQQARFELDDAQAETTTRPAAAPFRHRIVGFAPLFAPAKQKLSGQITFEPYDTCPADVAEVEYIFGGQLKGLAQAADKAA